MRKIDEYAHLDKDDKFALALTIPEVAKVIVGKNYGAHRMLSAMVHAIREKRRASMDPMNRDSPLADALEKLLNEGYYY